MIQAFVMQLLFGVTKNQFLLSKNILMIYVSVVEKKAFSKPVNDNALVSLALLIAESDPSEKDVLIKIIVNLIDGN